MVLLKVRNWACCDAPSKDYLRLKGKTIGWMSCIRLKEVRITSYITLLGEFVKQFDPTLNSSFLEQIVDMGSNGCHGNVQFTCNFLIR
jgi:hypothetical protein